MNLKELYQEIILDHGKNPRNLRKAENFNKDAKGHNPLCGDKVNITLIVDRKNRINDIKFSGEGCAISIASASLMTEKLKNKTLDEANIIFDDFTNLIKGQTDNLKVLSEDDSLYALKGVTAFPMRVKCATMAWHAYYSAVND